MVQEDSYLTVTALTKYLKRKFDVDPYLERVYLTGEISNWRKRPNHQYFSLKDNGAKISVTMFKTAFAKIKFEPEEGMKVLVTGRVSLYEPQGTYQIIIDSMQPDGVGALYQAFEQLKNKLAKEGLFDRVKKAIPKYPKRIAVITSASGAVIRDIITTSKRRYPLVEIVLFPAVVQGNQAAVSLVKRLQQVNSGDFDTIIIGRGGGSIEDLWPFNEENVVRQMAAMEIPIISSVGHETDITIADMVADVRAATPTAAAELATPKLDDLMIKIEQLKDHLITSTQNKIALVQAQLAKQLNSYVLTQPNRLYEGYLQRVDQATNRLIENQRQLINNKRHTVSLVTQRLPLHLYEAKLEQKTQKLQQLEDILNKAMQQLILKKQQELQTLAKNLQLVSPLDVLTRGYSITKTEKHVIKSINDVSLNQNITIKLVDGTIEAKVIGKKDGGR
ncbi:exodeoxyribonuclease VII large subunit [Periweissella beninensis]|uniref:Exodeoxyribonuclease 7 large subunit n=1 Tax=Periweissella beninensis TaxID=504936 RepID=A0ABT0VHX2_9LACO|nr:exodeoxyribonuclease VII large subunit [Periweissella beninensis]MBM7544010.1 exodeoxyribonuclease VII large subunit [Periweissella beninensis]MCM2437432.1 exodeoxyribonuclease VII large subunit [Periweissella beninensis]MCT4396519.1 exodeoxyribonuclease VII large subunit [Periweissella beninensis]